jgi:hypothetical protein
MEWMYAYAIKFKPRLGLISKMALSEQAAVYLRERLAGRSFRDIAKEHGTKPQVVRRLSRCARLGLPITETGTRGVPFTQGET